MLEQPSSSFLTACLLFVAASLPAIIIYRLFLIYRKRMDEVCTTIIPEVNTITTPYKSQKIIKKDELELQKPTPVPVKDEVKITQETPQTVSKSFKLSSGVRYVPKDGNRTGYNNPNRPNAGEDAFFVYNNNDVGSRLVGALGVADGVGGYGELGVDAGLMAWQMMENSVENFKLVGSRELYRTPREILHRSYEKIVNEKQVECGGTTACLVSIFKDATTDNMFLNYSNLGDSGFLLVRNGEVVFRTVDQTHYFNAPYQLAIPPKGRVVLMNDPNESDTLYEEDLITVKEGDYIILATDGMWDNVFDEDVVEVLQKNIIQHGSDIEKIVDSTSEELLSKTYAISVNTPSPTLTPFQRYAQQFRRNWVGGKVDDITLVVACISIKE